MKTILYPSLQTSKKRFFLTVHKFNRRYGSLCVIHPSQVILFLHSFHWFSVPVYYQRFYFRLVEMCIFCMVDGYRAKKLISSFSQKYSAGTFQVFYVLFVFSKKLGHSTVLVHLSIALFVAINLHADCNVVIFFKIEANKR